MTDAMYNLFKQYPQCLLHLLELIFLNELDGYSDLRMCFTDDSSQRIDYEAAVSCCGTFEAYMKEDGREVKLGCNYGH